MLMKNCAIGGVLLILVTGISAIVPPNPDEEAVELFLSIAQPGADAAFSSLPNYHRYVYASGDVNSITDGGSDMYDTGNVLRVWKGGDPRPLDSEINYNLTFVDNDGVFVGSSFAGNPFLLSTLIRNDNNSFYDIFIEEYSNLGADGSGDITRYSGTVQYDPVRADYEVYQVRGSGDASVVQVFFVLSSPTLFGSSGLWSLTVRELSPDVLFTTNNTAQLSGTMNNVYFGYMLLSFFPNDLLQQTTFESGLNEILSNIALLLPDPLTTTPEPVISTSSDSFSSTPPQSIAAFQVTRSLSALAAFGDRIRNQIPGFYTYLFDGGAGDINDGGFDMYDAGNQVAFRRGSIGSNITYGQTYSFPDFTFGSSAIHPFTALTWFGSSNPNGNSAVIEVTSNSGADGSGTIDRFNGTFVGPFSNYTVKYEVFQLYAGGSDPSIVEVYFTLESFEWNSSPHDLQLEILSFNQNDLVNRATVNPQRGLLSNVMFGYTLLSKPNGIFISASEVENALREMAQIIITYGLDPNIQIPVSPTSTSSTSFQTSTQQNNNTGSSTQQSRPTPSTDTFIGQVLSYLYDYSYNIRDSIPDFYFYEYDSTNEIADGGNDMYDGGNRVLFTDTYGASTQGNYDQVTSGNGYQAGTHTGHPFNAIMWIEGGHEVLSLLVAGNAGANGGGNLTIFNGTVYYGSSVLNYHVYQISDAFDPTICEVYYNVKNPAWNSSGGNIETSFSSSTETLSNRITLTGFPSRQFLGYTLFSRANGIMIQQSEIENALSNILHVFAYHVAAPSSSSSTPITTGFPPFSTSSTPTVSRPPPVSGDTFIGQVLTYLNDYSYNVRNGISNFYFYEYDGINEISDGGNDMYDGGNQVFYNASYSNTTRGYYDQVTSGNGYQAGIHTGYPFNAIMWIEGGVEGFSLGVSGNAGADGSGNLTIFNGTLYYGSSVLNYHVFQISDAFDPTICEIYYNVKNPAWNSIGGNIETSFSSNTETLSNRITLTGYPSHQFLGYTLFSRTNGILIQRSEIENALSYVLHVFAAHVAAPSPSSPPTFTTGSPPFSTSSTPTGSRPPPVSGDTFIGQVLSYLNDYSYNVRDGISNFYFYEYDGINEISDGGNDMYDNGNRVFYNASYSSPSQGYYDQVTSGNGYQAGIHTGYPFNAIMWIEGGVEGFSLGVTGNAGADGSGNITIFNGTVYYASSVLNYHVFQISGAGDPTICEVYYNVKNPDWNSSGGYIQTSFSSNTNILSNVVTLSGYPSRQFLGYTLFSKPNGTLVQRSEIENALSFVLHVFAYHVAAPSPSSTTPLETSSSPFSTFTPPFSTSSIPTVSRPPPAGDTFIDQVLSYLYDYSYNVRDGISNFYFYEYDGINEISDGGGDMYDGGNRVYFAGPFSTPTQAYYDQVTYGNGYQAGIHTGYPFNALMWIDGAGSSYSLEVTGNTGADGSGNITVFNGTVYYASSVLNYHVFQISGAGDPTICEVYYNVKNPAWNSTGGSIHTSFSKNGTDQLSNVVTLLGFPRNQFLGYTLFSRRNGAFIHQHEIENALSFVLHVFAYHVAAPSPTSSPPFTTSSSPFSTFSPPFTTPTGSTPPPVTDLDFLPSCSLREAIRRVWSCESAFTSQAPYSDPNQCRSNINTAIHCAANQLSQCADGEGPNIFRRFNLPVDIDFLVQQIRYLASTGSSCYSFDPISAFCQKSSLPNYFFSPLGNMTSGVLCQPSAVQGVIRNLTDFYYAYVGARTSGEICMAYRKFREGFVDTLRYQCNVQSLRYYLDYYHPELFRYVQQALQVTLDSVAVLEISSCPKIAVNNSRTRISTEWLKSYAKWRSGYLPRWQASYIRWVEDLDSLYQPLPDVPPCLDLTGISCRDSSQYSCNHDYYSCQFCYCLDHRYNGLTQALLEPWTQDFRNWEQFMNLWDEAYNSWRMNDGVL